MLYIHCLCFLLWYKLNIWTRCLSPQFCWQRSGHKYLQPRGGQVLLVSHVVTNEGNLKRAQWTPGAANTSPATHSPTSLPMFHKNKKKSNCRAECTGSTRAKCSVLISTGHAIIFPWWRFCCVFPCTVSTNSKGMHCPVGGMQDLGSGQLLVSKVMQNQGMFASSPRYLWLISTCTDECAWLWETLLAPWGWAQEIPENPHERCKRTTEAKGEESGHISMEEFCKGPLSIH